MPAESPRAPSTPVLQEAWEELRTACFTSCGEGFVWAAGCPAEYYVLALHLAGSPGFRCDLTDNALVLIAFGARHVIPLAQLSPLSLQHLHVGVVGEQIAAIERMRKLVHERYQFDSVPEDISRAINLH